MLSTQATRLSKREQHFYQGTGAFFGNGKTDEVTSQKSQEKDNALYFADGDAYTLGVNRSYENITSITQKEVYGKNLRELEGVFFKPSVTLKVLENNSPVMLLQRLINAKKNLLVTGSPVFDESGNIVMVITVVNEVSQRHLKKIENNFNMDQICGMVFRSQEMQNLVNRLVRVASVSANVLVSGETGTGKELVAQAIHELSDRKNQPFITVNASSVPENLMEAELFGYVKGAFTGAGEGNKGLIRAAEGGVLFLDEIGELPLNIQSKILRLLEYKEFIPVGSNRVETADIRIIAATNKDLFQMVKNREFREDLYYRLNVLNINVPALRERKTDIPVLAYYFLDEFNKNSGITKDFEHGVFKLLNQYHWPGNIRELRNLIERVTVLNTNPIIKPKDIEKELSHLNQDFSKKYLDNSFEYNLYHSEHDLNQALASFEKKILEKTLEENDGLQNAARKLNIHRTTLLRKLYKYGLK